MKMVDAEGNVVASYEYDPYGKVISASGTMASANPLRYRGYYYDYELELYYLQSRYYDPNTGRFINADTQFDSNAGVLGYNLFAYCANNPVAFRDDTGEGLLLAMAIGFVVGAAISGIAKVAKNYKTGNKWWDGLAISMLAGGIGGAISCVTVPGWGSWACASVFGATGNLVTKVILGEIKSIGDVVSAVFAGAAAGLLGNASAKLLTKGITKYFSTLTKAKQKAFLSRVGQITNAALKEIRREVSKGLTPKILEKLIRKYGYDVLVSAFVSSTATSIP